MKYLLLNSSTLRLSTSSVMSQMPLVANVGIKFTNKALRRLASPSSCGILGNRAVTPILHNIDSTGRGHVAYLKNLACPGCMTGYWVRMVEQSYLPALTNLL